MADKALVDNYLKVVLQLNMIEKYPNINQGIKNTLYRLPDNVFKKMIDVSPLFIFIIPEKIAMQSGYIKEEKEPINLEKGFRLIILRAELDKLDMKSITGIIAHELAHAYLHYSYKNIQENDKEADDLVIKWNFKEEIIAARANKKINAMESKWQDVEQGAR